MINSSELFRLQQKLRTAKEQFLLEGYAMIPGLWTNSDLTKAIGALEEVLSSVRAEPKEWKEYVLWQKDIPDQQLDDIPIRRIQDALAQIYIVSDIAMHHPNLRRMILSPNCIAAASYLLGGNIICHFSNFTGRAAEIGASCQWHRDWPNAYCSTRDGSQIRLMICLDGMESGQGVTRVIPGSQHWDDMTFRCWQQQRLPLNSTGKTLQCPPGGMIVLGPTIVHGAEANRSNKPRRNLIVQWGRQHDPLSTQLAESLTGYIPHSQAFFTQVQS